MAAFLVITLLTWAAVSVSETTQELSSTTGDTVNIPCPVGEGTLRYILIEWYSNDSTEKWLIFKLVDGDITIKAEYENRAIFPEDYSKLILKEITVADEGTYRCVVDTLKQTVESSIYTKLNVFSLRPDTLPVISPYCTEADESSSCSVLTNQSFTLTCALPNVYPVQETKLIWYRDGQRVSFTDDVNTQNADGTTDISRRIRVSETGNFTCNTTYLSAYGKENTAVSVEAWVIPPTDVPNTPERYTYMTIGFIVGMIIAICIRLLVAPITRVVFSLNAKGRRSFRRDENELKETQLNQDGSSALLPSTTVRYRYAIRTNLSSLDILERFIRSGLHPKVNKWVRWPREKTVVCLIDYLDDSKESVIKHNDPHPKHAEEMLLEYINSKLDKTKIKSITLYLNNSSCTPCSRKLQILKKEIPDLQIKFSAFYHIRRQSCTESCGCRTTDPELFKILRKLEARPFQKDDWDDLIDLLREDDEKQGHPTSDLDELRYGDEYGVWRNEEDEKMLADYHAAEDQLQ